MGRDSEGEGGGGFRGGGGGGGGGGGREGRHKFIKGSNPDRINRNGRQLRGATLQTCRSGMLLFKM